jgi:hypothetical protein
MIPVDASGNFLTCPLCVEAFTAESKVAQSFACPCVYHTACLGQKLMHFSYFHIHLGHPIVCPCGATIAATEMTGVASDHGETSEAPPLPQVPDTAEYKKDATALRKKITEMVRAKAAYKNAIVQAKRTFKDHIAGELMNIRNAKKLALAGLKASPEARAMRSKKAAAAIAATRLRNKYKLKQRQVWNLFPRLRERGRWRSKIPHILWRAFRVRL